MDLHTIVPPSSDGSYDLDPLSGAAEDGDGDSSGDPFDPEKITTVEVEPGTPAAAEMEAARAAAAAAAATITFSTIEGDLARDGDLESVPEPARTQADADARATTTTETEAQNQTQAGPRLLRKRKVARKRWDGRAWVVSAVIHVGILGGLALIAAGSGEVIKKLANLDASMVPANASDDQLTRVYANALDTPKLMATGNPDASSAGASVVFGSSIGGAAPSNTPSVRSTGRPVGEKTSLPMIASIAPPSGLQMMPTTPSRDLGGGGMIGGDVTFAAPEVGVALDQIAREILRHVSQHKVTVVWLFDESESMKDDQKAIKAKFDRVVSELNINTPEDLNVSTSSPSGKGGKKKAGGPPLNHAIVGFGEDVHFEQEKPTADIEVISRSIDRLRIDTTGKENTMSAVGKVIAHYSNLITAERKLLIVLVTDESGDDGDYVEEARQAAVSRDVPIYIIGRQALFGYGHLTIAYTDPVTKDVYWVGIRRGPETADVESLQYDGLHPRWDEMPSGFAPYELARLAKDTGGIYFLLPSEENLRVQKQEKAYAGAAINEYKPDYESRSAYAERRQKSELRRTLYEVIAETKNYGFRHHFPVYPNELIPAIEQELPLVKQRLATLIAIEKRLKKLAPLRDREVEKRWQASYDLMLAQVVAYQVKAYEYGANLVEMRAKPPKPNKLPSPELSVVWSMDHSHEAKAPKNETEKVAAEALRLLNLVIERHPKTPWADLAQREIDRGLSVKRNEWDHAHTSRYQERAKLVPKF